jgi:hypothetical protein
MMPFLSMFSIPALRGRDVADPTPEVWNWLDSIWGYGAGVVSGVLAMVCWVSPKFKAVNTRIDTVEKQANDKLETLSKHAHEENDDLAWELHGRITTMEKLVVVLQENHGEYMRVYQRVEAELKTMSTMMNEQNKILYELRGEQRRPA